MQFLILFSFVSSAFASSGAFNAKIANHKYVLDNTRSALSKVANVEQDFAQILIECKNGKANTQDAVLNCGARFTRMKFKFRELIAPLDQATALVEQLPPDFDVSKESLKKSLDTAKNLVNIAVGGSKKAADTFYKINQAFVQKQFERTWKSQFEAKGVKLYCANFEGSSKSIVEQAKLLLDASASFPQIYKFFVRVQSLLALGKELERPCGAKIETSHLAGILPLLKAKVTAKSFAEYKAVACNYKPNSGELTVQECKDLPLSLHSIEWFEKMGARR